MKQKAKGQAMITVLYVMVIGALVTTGAIYALLNSIAASSGSGMGMLARTAAESGAEDAVLQIIRDPGFSGETITLDDGQHISVSVVGGSQTTITSTATVANVSRRIQVVLQYTQGVLQIVSWQEIP